MDESLEAYEQELAGEPIVYGDDQDIMETYNALWWAVSSFGEAAREGFQTAVHAAVPRIKEIESMEPEQAQIDFFTNETEYAHSIDALAEAVKAGQAWLHSFMEDHGLPVFSTLVPGCLTPGARIWRFGKITEWAAKNGNMNVAAMMKLPKEDE